VAETSLDVRVRPHLVLAWIILLGTALMAGVVTLVGLPGFLDTLPMMRLVFLGSTLLVAGIACWYLPSFAKRAVTPRLAAQAIPVLGGAAAGAELLRVILPQAPGLGAAADVGMGLTLLALATVLLVSPLAGPPWRGGTPAWRKPGDFRMGDLAALAGFASSAALLVHAGVLIVLAPVEGIFPGSFSFSWPLGLVLFVLAGLAHLLPRARGAPMVAALFLAGVALADGALLLLYGPGDAPDFTPGALGAGLLLCAVALGVHGRGRGKPAGPRLREAGPLLVVAWLALVGVAASYAVAPWGGAAGIVGLASLVAALLLGLAGLSLLTLPVLANQRPAGRLALPAALVGLVSYALLPLGVALGSAVFRAGVVGLALFLVLWMATLWPLRKPRRECPPREAEPS
jgi:hypothetical protein